MNPANPYATPASAAAVEPASVSALGELVKGWEKRRLLYNGVMLLPGIGVLAVGVAREFAPWPTLTAAGLMCGLAANAGFFGGPLAELYLRALLFKGNPQPWLRTALFIAGCLLSFVIMGIFLIGILVEPLVLAPQ
ncbi:hypothetical protein OVA24_18715 [Luteolibacter sp. SL250]|uniref:hypothetical protein n=1 Tax=Luteolibacter sp. SL250 TaxID=2995170 RepID=UPI00226DAA23|nr:hypothetical protein [Luteolibacter sp. SL250]WAC19262.1 hypothetical protein OVA24_18715 [Luteolibacter sp. SL250]